MFVVDIIRLGMGQYSAGVVVVVVFTLCITLATRAVVEHGMYVEENLVIKSTIICCMVHLDQDQVPVLTPEGAQRRFSGMVQQP